MSNSLEPYLHGTVTRHTTAPLGLTSPGPNNTAEALRWNLWIWENCLNSKTCSKTVALFHLKKKKKSPKSGPHINSCPSKTRQYIQLHWLFFFLHDICDSFWLFFSPLFPGKGFHLILQNNILSQKLDFKIMKIFIRTVKKMWKKPSWALGTILPTHLSFTKNYWPCSPLIFSLD